MTGWFSFCVSVRRRGGVRVVTPLLLLLHSGVSGAVELALAPEIEGTLAYHDNFNLSPDTPVNTWESSIVPGLGLTARSQRWQIAGNARFNDRRFSTDSDRNEQLWSVAGSSLYRTQRDSFTFNASYAVTSTLQSQIDLNTGEFNDQQERVLRELRAGWAHVFSPRVAGSMSLTGSDVTYDDAEALNFSDSEFLLLSGQLNYQFSRSTNLNSGVSSSAFKNTTDGSTSDTISLQLGANHNVTSTLSLSLSAGVRATKSKRTESSFIVIPPNPPLPGPAQKVERDNDGFDLSVRATKQFLTAFVAGGFRRALEPSIDGTERETNGIFASVGAELTPTLRFALDLDARQATQNEGVDNTSDRDQLVLSTELDWELTDVLQIDTNLRFRRVDFPNRRDPALTSSQELRIQSVVVWDVSPDLRLNGGYRFTQADISTRDGKGENHTVFLTAIYEWPTILF